MNDTARWRVARLDDIERRDRDIPVREHFGIRAFGVNAYTARQGRHADRRARRDGRARRSCTSCSTGRRPSRSTARRSTRPQEHSCSSGRSRSARRRATEPSSRSAPLLARRIRRSTGVTRGRSIETRWSPTVTSAIPTQSKRFAGASSTCRITPASTTTTRASPRSRATPATTVFAHLRRAVELLPRFREDARRDDDFAAVRDDPRFEEALR